MKDKDNNVKFYENELYSLSYLENSVFFSSNDILNSSEFEIIFDGHISIQDSIFLKQVERIVTSEDIKMQYLDPNEVDEDFIDEFMLFPFFLKHNGISLVKDEEMAYNDESFSDEFSSFLEDNKVEIPPFSNWLLHGQTKLNKLLISRIYCELILKPIIQNVRKTGGYFETINTSTEELCKLDENQFLEFKETSWWNENGEEQMRKELKDKYYKGINTAVQEVTLKAICAFGNSSGGVLIIGKKDEKDTKNNSSILGWDKDKNIQQLKDRDSFELFWRDKVENSIDKYSANELRFDFDIIQNKEVVRITVPPRKISESFCSVKRKNNIETIYIRSGNSSKPLDQKDSLKQFRDRFNN